MSFAPPFALLKRIDPLDSTVNRSVVCTCNAGQYGLNGLLGACYFKGNSESLGVAFLLTGLISGILNILTIQEGNRRKWSNPKIRFALTAEDLICDSVLLGTIGLIKSLKIEKNGLYIGLGLVGLDILFTSWDYYWARKEYYMPSSPPQLFSNSEVENEGITSV